MPYEVDQEFLKEGDQAGLARPLGSLLRSMVPRPCLARCVMNGIFGGNNWLFGGAGCNVDGITMDCSTANAMAQAGAAIQCAENKCAGVRAEMGQGGTTVIKKEVWIPGFTITFGPDQGVFTMQKFRGHWDWLTMMTLPARLSSDVPVRMDFLRKSAECQTCGDTIRNTAGAVNTVAAATVLVIPAAIGAAELIPAAAAAAPYVSDIVSAGFALGPELYYNPATWAAAVDIMKVLTPPVSLPQTWPGFGVCILVSCWEPN